MMKCFSKLTYTMAAFSDLEFGLGIAQSATEYGVDGFSTPQVMAFALELYENGILTDDDVSSDGVHLMPGSVYPRLLAKMSHVLDYGRAEFPL